MVPHFSWENVSSIETKVCSVAVWWIDLHVFGRSNWYTVQCFFIDFPGVSLLTFLLHLYHLYLLPEVFEFFKKQFGYHLEWISLYVLAQILVFINVCFISLTRLDFIQKLIVDYWFVIFWNWCVYCKNEGSISLHLHSISPLSFAVGFFSL